MKKNFMSLLLFVVLLAVGDVAAGAEEMLVVRGDEDYPPMEMIVNGKLTGLHVEIVDAVAARLGMTVKWQNVPWKRALAMMEGGNADAVTYIARTPEREKFAIFLEGNTLSVSKINFLILKENQDKILFDGDVHKFLESRDLLTIRGFSYGEEIDRANKHEVGTIRQLLTLLREKRYDVAVVHWGDFVGTFGGSPEMDEVVALQPPADIHKQFIAFSRARGRDDLAKRFDEAFAAFRKTPEYADILVRYGVER